MTLQNFIFSNILKQKLGRHLALWMIFSLYFFIVNFFPGNAEAFFVSKTYLEAFKKMIYIPVSIFSVYISKTGLLVGIKRQHFFW